MDGANRPLYALGAMALNPPGSASVVRWLDGADRQTTLWRTLCSRAYPVINIAFDHEGHELEYL